MTFDELLVRCRGLDRGELRAWIEEGWVMPEPSGESWRFAEVDVARVELILEIRREFAIDENGMPLVLSLLDQLYAVRRQMRRLCGVLAAQAPEVQAAVRQALAAAGEDGTPR